MNGPTLTLAGIGHAASYRARRKALLEELQAQRWNLTATAKVFGMNSAGNVIRSIKALDLVAEYEAARAAGLIRAGARNTSE